MTTSDLDQFATGLMSLATAPAGVAIIIGIIAAIWYARF